MWYIMCDHNNTIEDYIGDGIVCIDCHRVVDISLYPTHITPVSEYEDHTTRKVKNIVEDFIQNNNLGAHLINLTVVKYKEIKKELETLECKPKRLSEKNITIYSLLDVFTNEGIPYNIDMVYDSLQGNRKTYWNIFKLDSKARFSKPHHYMNYYKSILQLSFQDYSNLMKICDLFDASDMRPECLAGGIVYKYCQEMKKNITIQEVSNVLHVSRNTIKKFQKQNKVMSFHDQISFVP